METAENYSAFASEAVLLVSHVSGSGCIRAKVSVNGVQGLFKINRGVI